MSAIEKWIAKIVDNKATILRYAFIPQALVGVFLILFSYEIGKAHFNLIRNGARAQGKIVGFKQVHWTSGTGSGMRTHNPYMPIVEFKAVDRTFQFQDWVGSATNGGIGIQVSILYDPNEPTVAMIDRPIMNWIPWGPTFIVGVFLCLVAVKGWLKMM